MKKWSYDVNRDDTAVVKGIAIMLMLVHHLFAFPNRFLPGVTYSNLFLLSDNTTFEWHFSAFAKICVALFTLLAGFGIFKSSFGKLRYDFTDVECNSVLHFFFHRFKKLYLKVWPVFIVFVPLGLILDKPNVNTYVSQWIRNALLIETNFNFEWWFLTEYLILVLLTPIVFKFFERKKSTLYSDIVWIVIFNVFVDKFLMYFIQSFTVLAFVNASYFWVKLSVALNLMPIFMLGMWMAKYDIIEKFINKFRYSPVLRNILCVAILLSVYFLRDGWKQPNKWGMDHLDMVYSGFIALAVIGLFYRTKIVKKVLVVIGAQSTGIWLTHSFFCYYYFQTLVYSPKNPVLIFLLVFCLSFASSVLLDYATRGVIALTYKVRGKSYGHKSDDSPDSREGRHFKSRRPKFRKQFRRPPRESN